LTLSQELRNGGTGFVFAIYISDYIYKIKRYKKIVGLIATDILVKINISS